MEPIIFQAVDWRSFHEEDEDDDEKTTYKINIYGRTQDNKTVCVCVDKYSPFFYVEIPSFWNRTHVERLVDELKSRHSKFKHHIINYDVVERHKFIGFNDKSKFRFLRLIFDNQDALKFYFNYLKRNKITNPFIAKVGRRFKTYEGSIEPILRFMHIAKVNSAGWIRIEKYTKDPDTPTICDINIRTTWQNVHPYESKKIQPFKVAYYDIECVSSDESFPQANRDGDKIIQIGTVFCRVGEETIYYKNLITLDKCAPIPGVDVESYDTEKELIEAWGKMMQKNDPDFVSGYNIFGFDNRYIYDRSVKTFSHNKLLQYLNKIRDKKVSFETKILSSSALGDNELKYFDMPGRVGFDLMKVIQKDHNLGSYKLDSVASHFLREKIEDITYLKKKEMSVLKTTVKDLEKGQYITIYYSDGLSEYKIDEKLKVAKVVEGKIYVKTKLDINLNEIKEVFWCEAKDDISHKMVPIYQKESPEKRAIIGKYCIQDCVLCAKLQNKLKVLINNVAMSNVCTVPLSYLFLRGQGIKGVSLVSRVCRLFDYLLEDRDNKNIDDNSSYEGAIVLDPKEKGVILKPIAVLDYASLYPRSMIHRNISPENLVLDDKYKDMEGYHYHRVEIQTEDGLQTNIFAQKGEEKGIIPNILRDLLDARNKTKKEMSAEKDPFQKSVLDGLQLAYKITANSIYGIFGAKTSMLYCLPIAASTTATGREMLHTAINFIEKDFNKIVGYITNKKEKDYYKYMYKLFDKCKMDDKDIYFEKTKERVETILEGTPINGVAIYGDTDSIFVNFNIEKDFPTHRDELKTTIDLGILAGNVVNHILPAPHDLEYEKTFFPFILLSKKRYVGNKFGFNPDDFEQNSMGIVLKRRDNAPILKIVYGGMVNCLLNERNKEKAVEYVRETMERILDNKYPIDKFIISKTLRKEYADRTRIAHVVLADRMKVRDPGNAPQVNDRIPYVFIVNDKKTKLQGDKVEHPDYILEKGLQIDYLTYITNQIEKPVTQILEYIMPKPEKLFLEFVNQELNRRKGKKPVDSFFMETSEEPMDGFCLNDS